MQLFPPAEHLYCLNRQRLRDSSCCSQFPVIAVEEARHAGSIVRILRFYASVVVLLVSGVVAFGVEPVRSDADLAGVTMARSSVPGVRFSDPMLQLPLLRALESLISHRHVSVPIAPNVSAVRALA